MSLEVDLCSTEWRECQVAIMRQQDKNKQARPRERTCSVSIFTPAGTARVRGGEQINQSAELAGSWRQAGSGDWAATHRCERP